MEGTVTRRLVLTAWKSEGSAQNIFMTAHARSRCEVFCIFVEVYTLGDELSVVFIHLYFLILNTSILFHAQPLLHCSSTCS